MAQRTKLSLNRIDERQSGRVEHDAKRLWHGLLVAGDGACCHNVFFFTARKLKDHGGYIKSTSGQRCSGPLVGGRPAARARRLAVGER